MIKQDKIVGVLSTKDYEKFKYRGDNRGIDLNHLGRLIRGISRCNDLHLYPIVVNEEYEVIDGQHRLMAAKHLRVEVYYVVDYNYRTEKFTIHNSNRKQLGLMDYFNFYVKNDYEKYVKVNELAKSRGVSPEIVLAWFLKDSSRDAVKFKDGVADLDFSEYDIVYFDYALQFIEWLRSKEVKPKVIFCQSVLFKALKTVLTSEDFCCDSFVKKLANSPKPFNYRSNRLDYINQILEIANHASRKRYFVDFERGKVVVKRKIR